MLLLLAAAAHSATFEETFREGLLALQRNDLAAAETHLTAAAKLQPDNGRVWVALSQTHRKLQQPERANEAAGKAESLGPNDPVVQSTLALYYVEAGQPLKSAEAQARYSSLVPQDAAARQRAESAVFDAVQPLLQQGKFGDAIPLLKAAAELLKGSAQLELALGVACYGLRRFDDAAAAFLRTIAVAPETEQPYAFLGKFLDQVPSRLPEITRRAIEYQVSHPSSFTGYFLHAKALNAQASDPDAALKLLEKALAIDDRDAAAHFELGSMLDRLRRYEDAAREFERAVALAPSDAAAHYRLSRLYDRLGKKEAAGAERRQHEQLVKAQGAAIQ
jgi:tetratricopeptide (TPR) repeat protein